MDSKYLKNQRKGHDGQECYNLTIDNYSYEKRRINNNSIMWYCKKWRTTRCNAHVKTSLDRQILQKKNDHNHSPLSNSHILIEEARRNLRETAVANRRESTQSICIREADRIVKINNMNLECPDVSKATKLLYNHPKTLHYHRRKAAPSLPDTIESIVLTDQYTMCS